MSQVIRYASVVCIVLIGGCGGANSPSKADLEKRIGKPLTEVAAVSGIVNLDGTPTDGVNISLYGPTSGTSIKNARTDRGGKFCFTTYLECDGLEPGEYKLTFMHVPKEKERGPVEDLLNGKYSDPKKTEFTLTVEKGKPQKNLKYDLTSK